VSGTSVKKRKKNMASRETMVMDLCGEDDRLQYDGNDEKRIAGLAALFTNVSILMIEAMHRFAEAAKAEVDENSVDNMKKARAELVMAWGALQVATSKIAGVFRVDGETALERTLSVAHTDEYPDVQGL
jgi:hypothetical protein